MLIFLVKRFGQTCIQFLLVQVSQRKLRLTGQGRIAVANRLGRAAVDLKSDLASAFSPGILYRGAERAVDRCPDAVTDGEDLYSGSTPPATLPRCGGLSNPAYRDRARGRACPTGCRIPMNSPGRLGVLAPGRAHRPI